MKNNIIIEKVMQFETRRDIFWVASGMIGLLLCGYVYCVTVTIRNIVTEKALATDISNLSQKISSNEFSYINMQNQITLSYAESMGFQDPKEKVFISPKSVSFVTSANSSM